MSWLDDLTPDLSDKSTATIFGALAGLGQAATPQYGVRSINRGNALFGTIGDIAGGIEGAQKEANTLQAGNIANQSATLNLQRQQAMQPAILQNAQSMMNPPGQDSGGSPMSEVDRKFATAYQLAMMSGKTEEAGKVLQSWAEHSPQLAGAIEASKSQNSVHETPNGPQYGVNGIPGFGSLNPTAASSAAIGTVVGDRSPQAIGPGNQQPFEGTVPGSLSGPNPPPSTTIPPIIDSQLMAQGQPGKPPPQIAPRQAAFIPPQAPEANAQPQVSQGVLASDGKPVVPNADKIDFFKPDPSFTPKYKTDNTKTGVSQVQEFQKADIPASENIAESANNTQQMLGRLHDIQDAYSKAQSGTLLAQDPDLANKFIAAGVLTDKGKINDVAQFQRIQGDQALEILNQLKGAISGSGGSKILNSEVKNATGKLGDPHLQPEAVASIMAVSTGLANYNQDMVKGWTAIGGLGNRVAGGYTLRPSDYSQQFSTTHNLDDYIKQAKAEMPAVKGTAAPVNPQDIVNELRKRGHKIQ